MRRTMAVVTAVTAFFMGCSVFAADNAAYYCPPGAKFCPTPGSATGAALPYDEFGAPAGRVMASGAANTLNPADVRLNPGEQLIMIAPASGNVSATQTAPIRAAYSPSPVPAPQQRYADPQRNQAPMPQRGMYSPPAQSWQTAALSEREPTQAERVYNGQKRTRQTESEVANETLRREKKETVANDERVPWYKGGVWRNRKGKADKDEKKNAKTEKASSRSRNDDYDDYDEDDDPVAVRKTGSAGASSGRQAPRLMDDDLGGLWDDDDEYTGYNSDGSFGRQSDNRQAPRPPADAPFPQGGNNGGMDLYASDPTGFAGPVRTASTSSGNYCPPEVFPDPYRTGQMSTYGPFDTSGYGGNDTYHPSGPSNNHDYSTGSFVNGQTYAAQSYPDPSYGNAYSDPYGSTYSAPAASGYPPPGYESYTGGSVSQVPQYTDYSSQPVVMNSSPAVADSPQFENAVRMVKDNRFSEAKAILTAETNRNPANAAAWRWLADCHYNLLELDDAIICYQQSLERDPNDYFALRGQGFAYLHRGHEYWRRMQEEVGKGSKEEAASTFALAHDDYKKSLELLGLCLRRNPTDGEAIFGEAMAAEGASRKLYSNALSYLKLGPGQRERAELFAENCLTVINKGIERSKERAKMNPGDAGPRALMGGLYLRKATLYHQLGKNDLALIELRNARDVQQSILEEIDKNNNTAKKSIRECEALWEQWGGNRS